MPRKPPLGNYQCMPLQAGNLSRCYQGFRHLILWALEKALQGNSWGVKDWAPEALRALLWVGWRVQTAPICPFPPAIKQTAKNLHKILLPIIVATIFSICGVRRSMGFCLVGLCATIKIDPLFKHLSLSYDFPSSTENIFGTETRTVEVTELLSTSKVSDSINDQTGKDKVTQHVCLPYFSDLSPQVQNTCTKVFLSVAGTGSRPLSCFCGNNPVGRGSHPAGCGHAVQVWLLGGAQPLAILGAREPTLQRTIPDWSATGNGRFKERMPREVQHSACPGKKHQRLREGRPPKRNVPMPDPQELLGTGQAQMRIVLPRQISKLGWAQE